MSNAKTTASLHLLRKAHEAEKRQKAEKTLGVIIGVGLMTLGAWGTWHHNFLLSTLFLAVLGWDLVKTFREEKPMIFLLTFSYTILLAIGVWFNIFSTSMIGAGLFAVAVFLHLTKK